jgi:hypothetical protein
MMMVTNLVSDYGWPAVADAAIVFFLLRSEIRISYSGRKRKVND